MAWRRFEAQEAGHSGLSEKWSVLPKEGDAQDIPASGLSDQPTKQVAETKRKEEQKSKEEDVQEKSASEEEVCEQSKGHPRTRRRFFTNGELMPSMARDFFFVDRSSNDVDHIADKLESSPYLLIHSHRQGGKSTHMHTLESQLANSGKNIIWLSVQRAVSLENPVAFWRSLMRRIYAYQRILHNRRRTIEKIVLASEGEALFLETFISQEGEKEEKNMVLFIDEMDRLLDGPVEIINAFLGALLSLRNDRNSKLYAFVGIGTFHLHDIVSPKSGVHMSRESPFSVSSLLQLSHFSKMEVNYLFDEYQRDSGVTLDPAVVEDIYAITNGHPGLVCLCGQKLDKEICAVIGKAACLRVDLDEWLSYRQCRLLPRTVGTVTYASMVAKLRARPSACDFLVRVFLHHMYAVPQEPMDMDEVHFLVAEGILRIVEVSSDQNRSGEQLEFVCPLIRNLCLSELMWNFDGATPPVVPFNDDGTLDLVSLVRSVLPYMSFTALSEHVCLESESLGDHIYHFLLYTLLAWTLRRADHRVLPEVTRGQHDGKMRMAMVILSSKAYILELGANMTKKPIDESWERIRRYSGALDASRSVVINFTTDQEAAATVFPSDFDHAVEERLQFLNIHVDLENRQFTLQHPLAGQIISTPIAALPITPLCKAYIKSTAGQTHPSNSQTVRNLFGVPEGRKGFRVGLRRFGKKGGTCVFLPDSEEALFALAQKELQEATPFVRMRNKDGFEIPFHMIQPEDGLCFTTAEDEKANFL